MYAILRHLAAGLTSAGIIIGSFVAVITFFGGGLPYTTRAEGQEIRKNQEKIGETLDVVKESLQRLNRHVDGIDCDRANGRYQRALENLRRNPNDQLAIDLRQAALEDIRRIDSCMPDPGPAGRY